jgi:proteasome lid subunit RPN8/RPN11
MKKDKDKDRKESGKESKGDSQKPSTSQTSMLAEGKITLRESDSGTKPIGRDFPGPAGADVPLRIAIEKKAYAELIAHAKESLDREVCGVLAGNLCEDDEGLFVSVEAAIRGTAASEASTHVTFTQATWNAIHKVLEEDYPKLKIVGWYHTHPGFGVEFSDMDLFIQKNFFSGSTQIALVTDPLNGAVAICVNGEDGAKYLTRFWVDGREQQAKVPARQAVGKDGGGGSSVEGLSGDAIQRLETRVTQLVQALDEQRRTFQNFLLFCGTVFCFAVLMSAGYIIWNIYTSRPDSARVTARIGDKEVSLPVDVVKQLEAAKLTLVPVDVMMAMKELMERAGLGNFPMAGLTNLPTIPLDAASATNSSGKPADPGTAAQNPKDASASNPTNAPSKP